MKARIISLVAVALVAVPLAFGAEFGVRAGRHSDSGENFVGAEMLFDIGTININPNIEYSLADDITAGSVNFDVTVDIARFATVVPYVGAGVGIMYAEPDAGGSTTDIVGNLIGGASFELAFLRPYAQVKYFRFLENERAAGAARDEVALTVGLRF